MKQIKQLKHFQEIGRDFMLNRQTALLADDMGLGKTVQAAAVIDKLAPERVLILTLSTLKINWERELKSWISHEYKYQIIYKIKDKIDDKANIIICNYDLIIHSEIHTQLRKLHFDVVVLDEAHNLSNMEAQRSKRVFSNSGLIRNANRVYCLTGTPVRNRPKDFYIMLKVLAPECIEPYTNYEDYAVRYCGGYKDSYGALNDKGASNIEELAERIRPFMLRRTKDEVLSELPPLIEKTIELEMTDEIEKVLHEETELQEDLNEYSVNGELGVQATIRRQIGVAKIPQVVEYVCNLLQTQGKAVIFAYHRDVINELRKRLAGYGVRAIMGGMNAKLKQMEVDLFIKDKNSRIFIGQFTAAGFGVDGLQRVASNVIFAEIDWVPGNMEQARDRVRRMGQTKPVVAHYLVIPETLEDDMLQTVIRKGKIITRLLSNTNNEKEDTNMTIENTLERIANSLELIAETQKQMVTIYSAPCEVPVPAPAPAKEEPKKKTTKKRSEMAANTVIAEPVTEVVQSAPTSIQDTVKAEPVETPAVTSTVDDLLGDAPQEPKVELTLNDVRTAFTDFIKRAADQATGVSQAKTILSKYGYNLVPDVKPEHYATIINELRGV